MHVQKRYLLCTNLQLEVRYASDGPAAAQGERHQMANTIYGVAEDLYKREQFTHTRWRQEVMQAAAETYALENDIPMAGAVEKFMDANFNLNLFTND